MPKDYKNSGKNKKQPNPVIGNILSFATGLTLGLFIAFLVYMEKIDVFSRIPIPDILNKTSHEETEIQKTSEEEETSVPAPTFDFYKILPNKEINISEWVADDKRESSSTKQQTENSVTGDGLYLLQIASFKELDAADQVKAKLTLLGITPEIQRVVINGQDIRYRVRVGPYKDAGKLNEIKTRLEDNNMTYMLLKLKAGDH